MAHRYVGVPLDHCFNGLGVVHGCPSNTGQCPVVHIKEQGAARTDLHLHISFDPDGEATTVYDHFHRYLPESKIQAIQNWDEFYTKTGICILLPRQGLARSGQVGWNLFFFFLGGGG